MAEFCNQCADELGFSPANGIAYDFVGLITGEETLNSLFAVVLCEDCGPCLVDQTGKCVSPYCLKQHGVSNATQQV